ncbi:MAG: UV DNA damage repair endonuclease UvsE [Methanoregula sp.]|nr:UV DNA damage repair endonuclease UvsE [Methanoregula sp.]
MRIGYPCINRSIGCTPSRTFRLPSYSDERLRETVKANLACLMKILSYNVAHGILFFRITSDMVPFASHPVCTFPWQKHFADEFRTIGEFLRFHRFRISMHPDQFVLLNAPDAGILDRSIGDLIYQVQILDLLGLDNSAKIQIHVGGVYGDKTSSMERFIKNYERLDDSIKGRLVIENDERLYTISDCLVIHERTRIPVLFDVFHHAINNNGEQTVDLLAPLNNTWKRDDGIPMVDYSSQQPKKRAGSHAECIDLKDFRTFLQSTVPFDIDIMLEIKDKEKSALAALTLVHDDPRLVTGNPGDT